MLFRQASIQGDNEEDESDGADDNPAPVDSLRDEPCSSTNSPQQLMFDIPIVAPGFDDNEFGFLKLNTKAAAAITDIDIGPDPNFTDFLNIDSTQPLAGGYNGITPQVQSSGEQPITRTPAIKLETPNLGFIKFDGNNNRPVIHEFSSRIQSLTNKVENSSLTSLLNSRPLDIPYKILGGSVYSRLQPYSLRTTDSQYLASRRLDLPRPMTTQRDSILESLESIAPQFPPQNFDVPDINTSNSLDTPPSLLMSGIPANQMYRAADLPPPAVPPLTDMPNNRQNGKGEITAARLPERKESSEDSDDSVPLAQLVKRQVQVPKPVIKPITKKQRTPKKRKKKDPNEPQKPVSAYALFFRDTQAAIKGQNPNASFGEVSKIVASMWEGLDPEHKDVYKKKTELAKKEYLKLLAAYRASLISQMPQNDSPASNSPPRNSPPMGTSPPQHLMSQMANSPVGFPSPQHMASPQHMPSPQHLTNPQLMASPQHMSSPQHAASPQHVHSPAQPGLGGYNSYQQGLGMRQPAVGYNGLQDSLMDLSPGIETQGYTDRMLQAGICIRNGCTNRAIDHIGWDNEYCSNECVVSHCRDVFTAWVSNRHAPVTSFPVT